jgi:hypothetical protein
MNIPTYKRFSPNSSSPIGDGKMLHVCEIHSSVEAPVAGERVVISGSVKTILAVDDMEGGDVFLGTRCIGITT